MRCHKCDSETPVNEPYCRVCGTELKVTYDQVTESLQDTIKSEKERETEEFCRSLLLMVLLALVVVWIIAKIGKNPPRTRYCPAYICDRQIEVDILPIYKPHVIWNK